MVERIINNRDLGNIEYAHNQSGSVLFRGKEYPGIEGSTVCLSFPFYNEEEMIPKLMNSLSQSPEASKTYVLAIDHRSSDDSVELVRSYSSQFSKLVVVEDSFSGREPAVPRKTGLDLSFNLATAVGCEKLALATVDSDVQLPRTFLEDIAGFSSSYDAIIFPMRNQQELLRECIRYQTDQNIATRCLLGADWFSFNIRYALIQAGSVEPNGGGFAITAEAYNKIGGFQPAFAPTGEIVLGANTEFGMKMQQQGLKVKVASGISHVSPRRVMEQLKGLGHLGGYSTTQSGAVGFLEANYQYSQFPSLTADQWNEYFNKQIRRGFVVTLNRAAIKGKLENLIPLFNDDSQWIELVDSVAHIYRENGYINNQLFESVIDNIGIEKYEEFIDWVSNKWIPQSEELVKWSDSESNLIDSRVLAINH